MKFIAFLIISILPISVFYNNSDSIIKPGETVHMEITHDDKHSYYLDVGKNKIAVLRLMQQGVDLAINVYDPEGEEIGYFDSPNGQNGLELIKFETEKKGRFKLEVFPLNEVKTNGSYELNFALIKEKSKKKSDMIDDLFLAWDSKDSPGAAVAVVKGDEIIYKQGYGMANLEYDIPNHPSTIFHIASVSKQFTVFAILLLEAEGKLSLEDEIQKHISEVPDFGEPITLRHLASHTSGMRDQWNLLAMAGWRLDDVITKEHVLKLVSKQKDLNFKPGEEFLYCNTGFTLLAEVVARVSGMPFSEFTEKNIFNPLGMKNTLFYDDHEKIVKNRAYSYYSDADGYKKSVLSYANVGATSLFTTVEDLSLWAMNFSKIKVGSKEIIEKMNTKAKLNSGFEINGALGQFVGEYKGLKEIQHGGADAGYRTYLTRYPEEDMAVVVFSNDATFNPGLLAHQVTDVYLSEKIKQEVEEIAEKPKDEMDDAEVTVSSDIMSSLEGRYELQPGFIIEIMHEEGKLFGQATGQGRLELEPKSVSEWIVKGIEARLVFNNNDEGEIESLTLHQSGQSMDAPKLSNIEDEKINLKEYEGVYRSDELTSEYTFTQEDDKLIVSHMRLDDFELVMSKEDQFSGNRWFFGFVEFTRDDAGKVKGCKVSSGRVRNLVFNKIK